MTPKLEREISKPFVIGNIHKNILSIARENGGVFSPKEYEKLVRGKTSNEKSQTRILNFNRGAVLSLVREGYLTANGDGTFSVTDKTVTPKISERKTFVFSEYHRRLILRSEDGILDVNPILASENARQAKITLGMVRNLEANGFLVKNPDGKYHLTGLGMVELKKEIPPIKKKTLPRINWYDQRFLDVIDDTGKVVPSLMDGHPNRDSLLKRLETFKRTGLAREDDTLLPETLARLRLHESRNKEPEITMRHLTQEERKVLCDIRRFQNLTRSQLERHIFGGNAALAETDISFLLAKKFIVLEESFPVYTLTPDGVKLAEASIVKYKNKVSGKKNEILHDLMIYDAYKAFEYDVLSSGGKIVKLETDREMRSFYAKRDGYMKQQLPDLRITYVTSDARMLNHDIEIDVEYDERIIAEKLAGMLGGSAGSGTGKSAGNAGESGAGHSTNASALSWICNTAAQARKVIRVAQKMQASKTKGLSKATPLTIYVMDDKGKLQKIKWS